MIPYWQVFNSNDHLNHHLHGSIWLAVINNNTRVIIWQACLPDMSRCRYYVNLASKPVLLSNNVAVDASERLSS